MKVELTKDGKVLDVYEIEPTGESDDDSAPCAAALIFDATVRGMFVSNAVVGLARELGWKGEDSAEDIEAAKQSGGTVVLVDTCQWAEQYLADVVPEGWSFGFSDGDFFLANDAWWSISDC